MGLGPRSRPASAATSPATCRVDMPALAAMLPPPSGVPPIAPPARARAATSCRRRRWRRAARRLPFRLETNTCQKRKPDPSLSCDDSTVGRWWSLHRPRHRPNGTGLSSAYGAIMPASVMTYAERADRARALPRQAGWATGIVGRCIVLRAAADDETADPPCDMGSSMSGKNRFGLAHTVDSLRAVAAASSRSTVRRAESVCRHPLVLFR